MGAVAVPLRGAMSPVVLIAHEAVHMTGEALVQSPKVLLPVIQEIAGSGRVRRWCL
jgi:hypothetical protein